MKCEELFKKIDDLYPEYVSVWEDVCNIESPTSYKEGVDEVCRYFIKMAQERGWDIELAKQKTAGDAACITMNPDSREAPVCFSGHMDTVHPIGLFGSPAVRMSGDKIYGPGVIDCKGGIVAAFLAMDALSQVEFKTRPVKLILQSDEETSSKTSDKKTVEFMCEKAKHAVAFFNTEGCAESEKWTVALSRKGILRYRFHIKGIASHSSTCDKGANAICEAAHKILELEKMKNPAGLTCNCGVIEGGTVANTVAATCSFLADIRFATEEEMKQAIETVTRIAENTNIEGCTCVLEKISERPPMEKSDRNFAFFEKLNGFYKQCGLDLLKYKAGKGGSDAAYITQIGVPCVDNIGVLGDFTHSVEEYAVISSLAESAKYMAAATYLI